MGEKGALLRGKQLTHVPKFVKAEADEQAAWIAERKKMKESAKGGQTVKLEPGASSGGSSVAMRAQDTDALLVECAVCHQQLPWVELSAGDGACIDCSAIAKEQ